MLSFLVKKELEKRKKDKTYKGSFAPVNFNLGYQGRSSFPSLLDCSLGSAHGFLAAALIDNGLNGYSTTVRGLTGPVRTWSLGAVPLLAMLRSSNRTSYGRNKLNVPSVEVLLYQTCAILYFFF
jgi:6-phosphofructokinase